MCSHDISLAILQAGAVPIQVVVVTSKQDVSSQHAPNALNPNFPVALFVRLMGHMMTITQIDQPGAGRGKHIRGGLAAKAAQRSAAIRQMFKEFFGFTAHSDHKTEHDCVQILLLVATPQANPPVLKPKPFVPLAVQ